MQVVASVTIGRAFAPRNISKLIAAGLAAVWFVAAGLQASGGVIYANYDGITPGSGSYSVSLHNFFGSYGQKMAVSFTTDVSTYRLDSVILNLSLSSGDSSDLSIELYDDSDSLPGASLGELTNPSLIGDQDNYIFTAAGLTLAPDTTYWIVAEPLSEMEAAWSDTSSSLGWACASMASGGAWAQWQPGQESYGSTPSLVVNGTVEAPEPSTYSLLALGVLALLGGLRSHRRLS